MTDKGLAQWEAVARNLAQANLAVADELEAADANDQYYRNKGILVERRTSSINTLRSVFARQCAAHGLTP